MTKNRYNVPDNEGEKAIFLNKLGLKSLEAIEEAELQGFLYAYKILFDELTPKTKFNLNYIFRIHYLALGHLYSFAEKPRTVNISKGGFMFPPAKFLDSTLNEFEDKFLHNLPDVYETKGHLIRDIARIHGELLFIHPFREGNGRTTRLLANLMSAKAGYKLLNLENFRGEKFEQYVEAIQKSAKGDYSLMEKIIFSFFSE